MKNLRPQIPFHHGLTQRHGKASWGEQVSTSITHTHTLLAQSHLHFQPQVAFVTDEVALRHLKRLKTHNNLRNSFLVTVPEKRHLRPEPPKQQRNSTTTTTGNMATQSWRGAQPVSQYCCEHIRCTRVLGCDCIGGTCRTHLLDQILVDERGQVRSQASWELIHDLVFVVDGCPSPRVPTPPNRT